VSGLPEGRGGGPRVAFLRPSFLGVHDTRKAAPSRRIAQTRFNYLANDTEIWSAGGLGRTPPLAVHAHDAFVLARAASVARSPEWRVATALLFRFFRGTAADGGCNEYRTVQRRIEILTTSRGQVLRACTRSSPEQ
jgi:hypothetical protein